MDLDASEPRSGDAAASPADGRISAVLFDLDGTLIATKRLYLEAYSRALEAHLGHLPTPEEVVRLRPRAELKFLYQVVGPERFEACLADFRRHYAELHATHFGGVYPGIREMLAGLRARGLRLGIVTGKSRAAWEVTIAAIEAELGSFDVTVFDDDVALSKPDPEGLTLAAERLGLPAARAAYVGDALSDVHAALAAGMRPIAVLWPKKPEELEPFAEQARAAGALIATRPEDVIDLVR